MAASFDQPADGGSCQAEIKHSCSRRSQYGDLASGTFWVSDDLGFLLTGAVRAKENKTGKAPGVKAAVGQAIVPAVFKVRTLSLGIPTPHSHTV